MLLHLVENYLRTTRTPPTRFGRQVLGDSRFVFDLREGRVPRLTTEARVLAFLNAQEQAGSPTKRDPPNSNDQVSG
jgi:hypothetical protein